METKHTPGPWRIIRAIDYTGDAESKYNPILGIEAANGKSVYYTDSGYFVPVEADARLIAAAPELLAALQNLLLLHKESPGNYTPQGAAARAAIAKATGK